MKERRRKIHSLIPLNLDGYLLSGKWQNGKATQVRQRLAADFTAWQTDAERFKLAVRRESKVQTVYALLVGKDGPQLKETPPYEIRSPG
jgi:hypothetical protein